MTMLVVQQEIKEIDRELEQKLNEQVAEILDAANEAEAAKAQAIEPKTATWSYSMPFAGVRYFTYS